MVAASKEFIANEGGGEASLERENSLTIVKCAGELFKLMWTKVMQLSEWLESRKLLDFVEKDYSDRVDLLSKVHCLQTAEKRLSMSTYVAFKLRPFIHSLYLHLQLPAREKYFLQQLISGVHYCHLMQICHRDLKLQNTIAEGTLYHACKYSSLFHSRSKSTVGTSAYIAPEVLSHREYDDKMYGFVELHFREYMKCLNLQALNTLVLPVIQKILLSGRIERSLVNEDKIGHAKLVLAQERTTRKDPLDKFKKYRGGWNIKERHYWASVAFTAAPFFVMAAAWFMIFGLFLSLTFFCYCCCRKEPYGYSKTAYSLSLVLLILFTIMAIVGCIVLYTGQGKFHQTTKKTLKYIVHQAEITANTLLNVSDDLAAAKKIAVAQIFLPVDVQTDIDEIQTKLNASAIQLSERTKENREDIHDLLESVRIALIVVSAVMLLWTFLGFLFSLLGLQCMVYTLVLFGWAFVTVTFILCGVFLCLHNVTADSCEAMNQWVENPTARTTLDDILPCVDNSTAHETSKRAKEVTIQLINVINQVVKNVTNGNFPPSFAPLYFNQSGPMMPTLCNPFNPDFTNRTCEHNEVPLSEATRVYKQYVCQVSSDQMCTTTGRLTPDSFTQMSAGIELSYSLYLHGPFLVDLQDCSFVRRTFIDISRYHCPGLRRYLNWIYIGLLIVSLAVMFSLVFWVIYGRERRHRVYSKSITSRSGREGVKYM
ncbi:uncharacterized protein [Rutidosis leptorrhynchoides]|uniref:uncharacterized protein n=1 Tax=Rutidosis leptorrhynchoides TaxID=125765 RepID=UPI003A99BC5E